MSGLFGGDKPKTPAPPPKVAHDEIQAASDAERRKRRQAGGRASTQLSGGSGVSSSANIGTSALLGG